MTEPNRQSGENEERIIEIEIERLRPFKEHPFQVKDDKEMFLLQESIEKYGILNPLIVRPVPDGYYEIISGHRRKHAAEKLGYRKVPVIIRVLSEDDSILSMVYMLSKVMKEKYEKEKFRYTSNTDELTRCYNRRAYEEDINKLNLSKEWVYVSMDLNGLKRANDSFGHVAGDELIRAAADCMKSSFSEHGKVYRVGGDEFVVIITKDIPQFENMLRTFEQRVASWHGEFVESMAVSYGYVFSSERKWNSIFDISKASDERMYESKKQYYIRSGMDRRR